MLSFCSSSSSSSEGVELFVPKDPASWLLRASTTSEQVVGVLSSHTHYDDQMLGDGAECPHHI